MTTPTLDPPLVPEPVDGSVPDHDRFPNLDGMRAIAALSVLVYHVVGTYSLVEQRRQAWGFIFTFGNFGVSIFFLLSGFLLYRPFVLAHLRDRPTPRILSFWKRRFLRIFPAYWVAVTVAILLFREARIESVKDFFTVYLLLQSYRRGWILIGLGVEWTLVIEVSFYLLLPFIALAIRALSGRAADARGRMRVQVVSVAVLYVGALAYRWWALYVLAPHARASREWFPTSQLDHWIFSYMDWFAIGMLLAIGSAWVSVGGRVPWPVRALARRPWISWLLALECFVVVQQLHLPPSAFDIVTRVQSFGTVVGFGLTAAFLLIPMVYGDQSRGAIRRTLSTRFVTWLGVISYGIYLWHIVVVNEIKQLARDDHFPVQLAAWFAVTVVLALALAAASHRWVEQPAIRLSHRGRARPGAAP